MAREVNHELRLNALLPSIDCSTKREDGTLGQPWKTENQWKDLIFLVSKANLTSA